MIKPGQHEELALALRKKRGRYSKAWASRQIGISVNAYSKLESLTGNTSMTTQFLARNWVNGI